MVLSILYSLQRICVALHAIDTNRNVSTCQYHRLYKRSPMLQDTESKTSYLRCISPIIISQGIALESRLIAYDAYKLCLKLIFTYCLYLLIIRVSSEIEWQFIITNAVYPCCPVPATHHYTLTWYRRRSKSYNVVLYSVINTVNQCLAITIFD